MTEEARVWIAQFLCPQRHCICALVGVARGPREAERTLPVQDKVDELLSTGSINRWCGICGAERQTWRVELGRTRWRSMQEAAEPLARNQAEQTVTILVFGTHGPKPPGKPN